MGYETAFLRPSSQNLISDQANMRKVTLEQLGVDLPELQRERWDGNSR